MSCTGARLLDDARTVVRELLERRRALVKAIFSGRQRNMTVPYRRVELRYVDLKPDGGFR